MSYFSFKTFIRTTISIKKLFIKRFNNKVKVPCLSLVNQLLSGLLTYKPTEKLNISTTVSFQLIQNCYKSIFHWHKPVKLSKNYLWYQNQPDFIIQYSEVHSPQLPWVVRLLDYKTTKMRFQKTFLLCCVTICAKIGVIGFMLQVIISYIEGLSKKFLLKYLLKGSKLG